MESQYEVLGHSASFLRSPIYESRSDSVPRTWHTAELRPIHTVNSLKGRKFAFKPMSSNNFSVIMAPQSSLLQVKRPHLLNISVA